MTPQKIFGDFIRARRSRLGLSLREFSRRAQLDPAYVSRLERGLISPPRSKEVLEAYAKSLNFQPASKDWENFFDVVAAANGVIPSEVLQRPSVANHLPGMLRKLRGQMQHLRTWTSGLDLEAWSDSIDARSNFPRLVRRLIHATDDSLVQCEIHADEQVQRPGPDGIVESRNSNAFVPVGTSIWEMGVGLRVQGKAEGDFKKNSEDSSAINKKESVFIFVTPRKWQDKDKWCARKNKLGIWKEVRVYDSSSLEQWLEIAPGVDAWLVRFLGRYPEGVIDISEHWTNLGTLSNPGLKPEVFLTSRGKEIELLKKWLQGPNGTLAIEAASPNDVIDFMAAFLAGLPEAQQDEIEARILIVQDETTWRALSISSNKLILICHPSLSIEPERIAEAVRQGHRVLVCSRRFLQSDTSSPVLLPRVNEYDLEKVLISAGFKEEEANRLAVASGGSLTILKRRISRFPSTVSPQWSRLPDAIELIPILLAGGWDDACEADREVMAKLASHSYNQLMIIANRWATNEDPPLAQSLSEWHLVSREDSWILLAKNITRPLLDLFEEVVLEVLGEDDPKYELPPDERWYAAIHKKILKYSKVLRHSLVETIALLGSKSSPDLIPDHIAPARRAERLIRKLLSKDSSWQRWASLSRHLALLAEAAPEAFLEAVEGSLRAPDSPILKLFEQEGDPLFGGSTPHTGLLWALEGLAWSPAFLSRVSLIFAALAEKDPGGKISNRPRNSLKEIFLPWLPQTSASVAGRITVLELLIKRNPNIGWQIVMDSLPSGHGVSSHTHRPQWHDWARNWSRRVTNREYWQQVEKCAQLLIDNAGDNFERWEQLLDKYEHCPPTIRDQILKKLQSFDVTKVATEDRRRIADSLREKITRHRSFSDADWAMPPDMIEQLEKVQKTFEPEDLMARHQWLFVGYPEVVESREMPYEERQKLLFEKRTIALAEILKENGFSQIVEFSRLVEHPFTVGYMLSKSKLFESDQEVLPSLIASEDEKSESFAKGYALGRFENDGWGWIKSLKLAAWSALNAGRLSIVLPFNRQSWDLVESLGIEVSGYYWNYTYYYLGHSTDADAKYVIEKLLQYECPFRAIDFIAMAFHQKCNIDSKIVMNVLETAFKPRKDGKKEAKTQSSGYDIQELFKKLQSDPEVDQNRLVSLEWQYLPILDGHGASPKALHCALNNDPQFFAKLLAIIFRSRKEPKEPAEEPTEEQRARANNAYRLLNSMETLPVMDEKDKVDQEKLIKWVDEARKLCEQSGHLEVCDINIGELLANAPFESDDDWPCIAVREVIEKFESVEMRRGFETGIFNLRGSFSKSLSEGGQQERALAKNYASYAEKCAHKWPNTAASLRNIAKYYEDDAWREDQQTLRGV